MYEYLLKKANEPERENYAMKAMMSTMYGKVIADGMPYVDTDSCYPYAATKRLKNLMYGASVPKTPAAVPGYPITGDVPFDLRCPGPRYEDSPEGDCGNCPYMQHGRCTAEDEGPDEPTGEYDEIDPGDRTEPRYDPFCSNPRFFGKAPFDDSCSFLQTYLDDEADTVFVIKWYVTPTGPDEPFITVRRDRTEISKKGHAVLVLKAIVDSEVFEDLDFDEVMEDVLDEAEDVTGVRLADVWERVIKTEVKSYE